MIVPSAASWSQIPIAPSAGPATAPPSREITNASIRLNAVCRPMPSASGAPKRATASPSDPDKIRFAEASDMSSGLSHRFGGAFALEAMIGDLAFAAQQRRAQHELGRDRIVI